MRGFSWKEVWVPTWPPAEIIFRAAVVYLFVQLLFRILGRKEWTQYATFNVVVIFLMTVALRTTIVGPDSSLTSGLIAISTILGLDWILSYLSYRSERLANLINGRTIFLIKNGRIQDDEMRRMRISKSQLLENIRLHGGTSIEEVEEALLERSGKFSIHLYPKSRTRNST